ncbi:hypothetical protein BST97_12215 [Nonlabens spongiae]|uniref:Antitoxin n=1 Tax=Nonlabens spongiae TaxID=331648 RepID=A0A1W6MM67_9FLAO|nr:DUF6364 family protein [Nonlabens spongiae]ARN78693.1 hypothetical protein BST97_12215 [Nonlabens spongiae]
MKTKLTLTVEKDVIEQAKEYAKNTGVSLSELIQEYLTRITGKTEKGEHVAETSSIYRKYAGIAKSDLDPVKDREKLRDIRLEKYLK